MGAGVRPRTIRKEPKMPETTYLPQVRCEISEGLTGSDRRKSGVSSSFLPEKMNRHRAKKLGT